MRMKLVMEDGKEHPWPTAPSTRRTTAQGTPGERELGWLAQLWVAGGPRVGQSGADGGAHSSVPCRHLPHLRLHDCLCDSIEHITHSLCKPRNSRPGEGAGPMGREGPGFQRPFLQSVPGWRWPALTLPSHRRRPPPTSGCATPLDVYCPCSGSTAASICTMLSSPRGRLLQLVGAGAVRYVWLFAYRRLAA